jgi:hypothetical protein
MYKEILQNMWLLPVFYKFSPFKFCLRCLGHFCPGCSSFSYFWALLLTLSSPWSLSQSSNFSVGLSCHPCTSSTHALVSVVLCAPSWEQGMQCVVMRVKLKLLGSLQVPAVRKNPPSMETAPPGSGWGAELLFWYQPWWACPNHSFIYFLPETHCRHSSTS